MTDAKYWTDYPILELGDLPGKHAPIRECVPITYDGNKYCDVLVAGVKTNFKAGYIYTQKGRSGDVPCISRSALRELMGGEK